MSPKILRQYIDVYGRWTLYQAAEMNDKAWSRSTIANELGFSIDTIESIILAGTILRRIMREQKSFEASVI